MGYEQQSLDTTDVFERHYQSSFLDHGLPAIEVKPFQMMDNMRCEGYQQQSRDTTDVF